MICSFSKEFSSSSFTGVENTFICEYMPLVSGDAVKVYLYGLYLCQNNSNQPSLNDFAEKLNLSVQDVKDCFSVWEEFGIVSICDEPFSVLYLPLRTAYGAKPRKFKAEKYADFSKSLQALIPARMISTSEYSEYFSIMETYQIKPEAMLMIVKYCVDRKGDDIGYKYVSKVAKDFGNRGISTIEKVEQELSSYVLRTNELQKILKALSLKRQPDIEDLNFYKKWTEELNFESENIVFAASKMKKGSMAKLDEFMMDLYAIKSFSKEDIEAYMKNKQLVYELAIKINRALSVYMDVIDTVVDTYTKKWLSYGFSDQTLLFIADYCFKNGNNKLPLMDELVESLFAKGIIDLVSVNDYFADIKKQDAFIKEILITAGVNRRPNDWDRNNLSLWRNWNFSDDMILEGAKLASGKTSPIPYLNGVLGNWKAKGIFSVEQLSNDTSVANNSQVNTQESYNLEYARRRTLVLSIAQNNLEKAQKLDGFNEIYSRLNSIEKDLAFAEITNNLSALESLEIEKTSLQTSMNDKLKTINLTFDDLSPKYACTKCNDTGYVGTHKCDCFDKIV